MKTLDEIVGQLTPVQHACLSLSWFLKATGRSDNEVLMRELMELSKGEGSPLEAYGMYMSLTGEEHAIEGEEFELFLSEGVLVCPEKGEIVENPEDVMCIYWAKRQDHAPSPT